MQKILNPILRFIFPIHVHGRVQRSDILPCNLLDIIYMAMFGIVGFPVSVRCIPLEFGEQISEILGVGGGGGNKTNDEETNQHSITPTL